MAKTAVGLVLSEESVAFLEIKSAQGYSKSGYVDYLIRKAAEAEKEKKDNAA